MSSPTEKSWFTTCLNKKPLVAALQDISLIITDVDGCLTDNTITLHPDGTRTKSFSTQDGLGINLAHNAGIKVAFVSGSKTPITAMRAKQLGIPDDLCHLVSWQEKPAVVQTIQQHHNIQSAQTLVFGDDIADSALKPQCALFACPADAPFYIIEQADITSPRPGGYGSLRAIIDLLLFAKGIHPYQQFKTAKNDMNKEKETLHE